MLASAKKKSLANYADSNIVMSRLTPVLWRKSTFVSVLKTFLNY